MEWKMLLFILIGFLSGSVMYSFLLPKWFYSTNVIEKGEDHNPGTVNVIKCVGVLPGLLCLLLDMFKGFAPVFIAAHFVDVSEPLFAFVIVAPVAGHAFSPMLKWRGGKAIATAFGVLIAILPMTPLGVYLAASLIFFSVVITIRPNRLRVIVAFSAFLICALLRAELFVFILAAVMISLIVVFKHLTSGEHSKMRIGIFLIDVYQKHKEKEAAQEK